MNPRIVYGLSHDLPAFSGLTPAEIGERLRQAGCSGVFLKHLKREWVKGLQWAGLQVYVSAAIFSASDDIWERFADSRPITADGTPAPQEEWYRPVLPTLPAVRRHRLEQVEELLAGLPIDGLWLDFIRWPARWERPSPSLYHSSFDPITLELFQSDTGIQVPVDVRSPARAARWILEQAPAAWFEWRSQQIASFVAQARTLVRRHRPKALLGLFTVPWTGTELDQVGVEQANIRIAGQDLSLLGQYADVVSPMVYHRLCGRPTDWVGGVTGWTKGRCPLPIWPIVESIAGPETYPAQEFAAACRSAGEAGADGIMTFQLTGLLDDPAKIEVWREL